MKSTAIINLLQQYEIDVAAEKARNLSPSELVETTIHVMDELGPIAATMLQVALTQDTGAELKIAAS